MVLTNPARPIRAPSMAHLSAGPGAGKCSQLHARHSHLLLYIPFLMFLRKLTSLVTIILYRQLKYLYDLVMVCTKSYLECRRIYETLLFFCSSYKDVFFPQMVVYRKVCMWSLNKLNVSEVGDGNKCL